MFQRSDGSWWCQLTFTLPNGEVKRPIRKAKSRLHAAMLLEELKTEHRFYRLHPSQLTVSDCVQRWITTVRAESAISTVDGYERDHAQRIAPGLGHLPLLDLTPLVVQEWLDGLTASGVGARTRQQTFSTLKRSLDFAVHIGLIPSNPLGTLRRPKAPRKAIRPFTVEEMNRLLQAAQDPQLQALLLLAFTVGLRQGELFGLRWGNVDLEAGTALISEQARDYRGKVYFQKPKTQAGIRTVPLTDRVISALLTLQSRQGNPASEELVFRSPQGHVIRSTTFGGRVWRLLLRSLQIPHRGFHHVRHTAATLMLQRGVPPRTVAHVLGHANPGPMMGMYSHLMDGDANVVRDIMGAIGGEIRCATAAQLKVRHA